MTGLARIRKAIVGGAATGAGVWVSLTTSGAHLDPLIELAAAVGAAIIGGLVVYFTPNAPAT